MPVIRLKSVVLPAPLGPITLTISFSSTCRSRSVHGAQAAEGEAHLVELEQRRHQTISTRRSPSSPCGRAAIVTIRIAPIMICAVMPGSTLRRASQQQAAT